MNALVAGSGSYIVRLSVRDLHGPIVSLRSSHRDFQVQMTREKIMFCVHPGPKCLHFYACIFLGKIGQIVGWYPL